MEDEIWRNIPDFSLYEVSNKGRVRNKKTNYIFDIKPNKKGFIIMELIKDTGGLSSKRMHILVASIFISNSESHRYVSHIDKIITNNCVENLQWSPTKPKNLHNMNKPTNGKRKIEQLNKKTEKVIKLWNGPAQIAKELNCSQKIIINACNNPNRIYLDYKWRYFVDKPIDGEIWEKYKNIEVSNYGRIKRMNYSIYEGSLNGGGYFETEINRKHHLVHRMVATIFLDNPKNLPIINHKDGNKKNNHVSNLEWCTYQENSIHAFKTGLNIPSKKCGKQVVYKKNGEVVATYTSIRDASRVTGIERVTIKNMCHGYYNIGKDYDFKFLNDNDNYLPNGKSILLTKD